MGKQKFTVRRYVDAFVVYETEITATDAVEAARVAREKDAKLDWLESHTTTFDARKFVTLDPENSGEIEETTQGDTI